MSSDPEKDFLKQLFEQFTYEEIDNLVRALNEGKDEELIGDDDAGLDGVSEDIDLVDEEMVDESKLTFEEAKAAIQKLPPEKQEELANELLMKRAAQREWLGNEDDGFNHLPTAVLYGLYPESDVGKRAVIHHRAWRDMVELGLRRKAFNLNDADTIYQFTGGISDARVCKEAAAKLLKWCAKFSDDDTVAFGAADMRDMPEFKHYRVLAADEEQDDDWCHAHVASVKKFAAFLDQCGGFRFP